MLREPDGGYVEAWLIGHVLQVKKPCVVDYPLNEGRHEELIVGEIRDISCDRKGYVRVAQVVGNSLERDRSGGEHWWRQYGD